MEVGILFVVLYDHSNLLWLIRDGENWRGGGVRCTYVLPITQRDMTTKTIER